MGPGQLQHLSLIHILVRLAMHSSVNTSLTWQHLRMATLATPPQPITNTLLIITSPLSVSYTHLCGHSGRDRGRSGLRHQRLGVQGPAGRAEGVKGRDMMREIGIMEVGGFQVGHAQDLEAATGCTVILCDRMSSAGLDVRGGGPASRESQILAPVAAAQGINAVLLSGGSAFGLDAAGGVQRYLEERDLSLIHI